MFCMHRKISVWISTLDLQLMLFILSIMFTNHLFKIQNLQIFKIVSIQLLKNCILQTVYKLCTRTLLLSTLLLTPIED